MDRAGSKPRGKCRQSSGKFPKFSWIPSLPCGESAPSALFKFRKNTQCYFAWLCMTEPSGRTDCLFPSLLGAARPLFSLSCDRHSSRLLASRHPKILMCSGPRTWPLTIDPNLAVPILVASGQQCLGFCSRQVPGICREALQDGSGKKSQGGSQVKVTLRELCRDGGLASAQGKWAAGPGGCAGQGGPAMAVLPGGRGKGRLSSVVADLTSGRAPALVYLFSQHN